MQDALTDHEAKYRKIFQAESEAIVVVDTRSQKIVEVNATACELYGYSRDLMLRMQFYELLDEMEKGRQGTVTNHKIENFAPQSAIHRKFDKSLFNVESTSSSCELTGRSVTVRVIRDVTEQVRRFAAKSLKELRQPMKKALSTAT